MSDEKTTEETQGKKSNTKLILILVLTLVFAAGAGVGIYFIRQSVNYLTTDNARVTTTLIAITPPVPGILERFTIYEGQRVSENQILGWVEGGEVMRSPVDGIVIHTNAVQNQAVSPMEVIAVIADLNNLHIQANIEETDIARIQVGQSAIVTIDPFGSRQFTGYIREIGHITQAELTGNAMFFTTGGTFTRVTHLIPVKINITSDINLENIIGVNARARLPLRESAININRAALHPVPAPQNIAVRGVVESVEKRYIYSTLSQLVERVYVEAGDFVTEGQILAALDTVDLNIQLLNADAGLRIAEVNVAAAEHNHEMLSALYVAQAIPRNDFLQAEFALQSAMALQQQASAIFEEARVSLERATIRAPINGTVTDVIAREGASGMGLLFVIEDTDNLKIVTRFRGYDLGRLENGMAVTITLDADGSAEYAGVISRINPAAIADALAAEFEAEALVTSPETSLRIGMNVRLSIRL